MPDPILTAIHAGADSAAHQLDHALGLLHESIRMAGEAVSVAEAQRDQARNERDEARAKSIGYRVTAALERDKLKAEVDRAAGVIVEITAERDALRARVAELEARPALTTLPAPDRAEELAVEIYQAREVREHGKRAADDDARRVASEASDEWFVADVRAALVKVGAPPPAVAPGPVLAAVSVKELALAFHEASSAQRYESDEIPAGIRAVVARLGASLVAPVDPEAVAEGYHDHAESPAPGWDRVADYDINSPIRTDHDQARLRAAYAMRATLIAHGIPVTPEGSADLFARPAPVLK